jgi:hypothetical protein
MGYYIKPDKRDYFIKIIGIAIILFVLWKIGKSQISSSGKDIEYSTLEDMREEGYQKSEFYFPELDTVVIFRSNEGANWIIKKYQKYGANWREKLFKDLEIDNPEEINDLIDGTSKYLNKEDVELSRLKMYRFHAVQKYERKYDNLRIGYLQEAKRVIEDGEKYPWDGITVFKPIKKRKDYIMDFALKVTAHPIYTPLLLLGFILNFIGIVMKKQSIWNKLKIIGFITWFGTLLLITFVVFK